MVIRKKKSAEIGLAIGAAAVQSLVKYLKSDAGQAQLRRAPEIIFHWDPSPEKAEHIAHLLDEIEAGAVPPPNPPPAAVEPHDDLPTE
ncbi:MAG TPA: hypothetical protein PKV27_00660 [Ilumatobacteraceae bacterium]|nr:hypothetical protein [Ilumatobacteraceae bacterium]